MRRLRSATQLLGVSRRQTLRLLKALRTCGVEGLISKRGRPSNRRKPDDVRSAALAIIGQRYADFGPTLAAEKLCELHGISLGRETVRGWMIAAGFWQERKKRRRRIHSRATGATASASRSRSTAASTAGSRIAVPCVRC